MAAIAWLENECCFARNTDGSVQATIIIGQALVLAATRDDPDAIIPGPKDARAINGEPFRRLGEGRFEVTSTGMLLMRV